MSNTLSPSNLVQSEVGDPDWGATQNSNIQLLDSTLLRFSNMLDTNYVSLQTFDSLQWNAGAGEWVNTYTL